MDARGVAGQAVILSLVSAAAGCGKALGSSSDGGGVVSAPSTTAPGAPRPGMVWIPTGLLRSGSAVDEVPRMADIEPAGVEVPLGGFYMDVLPWPNEAGAIQTTNVSQAEAQLLCQSKGKRLCTELEWERACKGPDNQRYEYGPTYDAKACGGGQPVESAAKHPSGDKLACKSGFGVREMHGGAWEWTDSPWNRSVGGRRDVDYATLRGGTDVSGELVTRCAYAKGTPKTRRSATTGFRCCEGPRNEPEVEMEQKWGAAFERTVRPARSSPALDALEGVACGPPLAPAPCSISRAWTWRPSTNVELQLGGGCVGRDPSARCALAVWRMLGDRVDVLAQIDTGREIPEVVLVEGMDRRIRVRGADIHGPFFREIIFSYGKVDVREVH